MARDFCGLVSCPRNSMHFAGGQLAVFSRRDRDFISEVIEERTNDLLFEDGGAPSAESTSEVGRPASRTWLRIERDTSFDGGVCFNSHAPWDRRVLSHEEVNDSQASPIKVRVAKQFRACFPQFR